MTITLHLGVNDTARTHDNSGMTNGDLAEILEAKYHVMEVFAHLHEKDIADALAESGKNALEAVMGGAAPTFDPWGSATSEIELMFNKAIDMQEFDGVIPGVPTQAAKDGTSARFKKIKPGKKKRSKKRGERPSFYWSGQYESSFRAWVD